jgi:hypothetical protein
LNALLAVLAAHGAAPPSSPTESLFWRTWIPIGWGQLFADPPPTPLGAFSRRWLERGAAAIEEAWNRGLDPSCDVVLGVSATRVEPRVLHAAGGRLELPRMEEKFAIRIQGRGRGRPPRVSNYPVPASAWPAALLVTDARGEVPFSELRDLVFASMSFPIAFPPQPLRTCVAGETLRPGVCLDAEAHTARYVDGGVFDNAPLRLAVGLARIGLHADPESARLSWRDIPDASVRDVPRNLVLGFIDPDAAEYPARRPADAAADDGSLPRHLFDILAAFVDTARSKELAMLLEEHPAVADRDRAPEAALSGRGRSDRRVLRLLRDRVPGLRLPPRHVRRLAHAGRRRVHARGEGGLEPEGG